MKSWTIIELDFNGIFVSRNVKNFFFCGSNRFEQTFPILGTCLISFNNLQYFLFF